MYTHTHTHAHTPLSCPTWDLCCHCSAYKWEWAKSSSTSIKKAGRISKEACWYELSLGHILCFIFYVFSLALNHRIVLNSNFCHHPHQITGFVCSLSYHYYLSTRIVVLKFQHAAESPGGLVKRRIAESYPRVSDSLRLWWSWGAAVPETIFWEPLLGCCGRPLCDLFATRVCPISSYSPLLPGLAA